MKQAVLSASQTYSHLTQSGTASIEIKKDGGRIATASATVTATSQQGAAGGITALMLFLTGRQPVDRSTLQISNIQFSGDITAVNADKIINWWDAKARLTYDNYNSPVPSLTSLGKLQLNALTIRDDGFLDATFVILYFDPADPTKIISGTLTRHPAVSGFASFSVVSGFLTELTFTPEPGDFHLHFVTDQPGGIYNADLALDMLSDGTIDVGGISRAGWPAGAAYTLEGTGNANFVIPNQ